MRKITLGGVVGGLVGLALGIGYTTLGGAQPMTTAVVAIHLTVVGGFVGLWITTCIVGPSMDSVGWHAGGSTHAPHESDARARRAARLRELAQTAD